MSYKILWIPVDIRHIGLWAFGVLIKGNRGSHL